MQTDFDAKTPAAEPQEELLQTEESPPEFDAEEVDVEDEPLFESDGA